MLYSALDLFYDVEVEFNVSQTRFICGAANLQMISFEPSDVERGSTTKRESSWEVLASNMLIDHSKGR